MQQILNGHLVRETGCQAFLLARTEARAKHFWKGGGGATLGLPFREGYRLSTLHRYNLAKSTQRGCGGPKEGKKHCCEVLAWFRTILTCGVQLVADSNSKSKPNAGMVTF